MTEISQEQGLSLETKTLDQEDEQIWHFSLNFTVQSLKKNNIPKEK